MSNVREPNTTTPAGVEHDCRFCGRTGTRGFVPVQGGQWQCKSEQACLDRMNRGFEGSALRKAGR